MSTHIKLLLTTAIIVLGLLAVGTASIASDIITPANPDDFGRFEENSLMFLTIPAMEIATFTEVTPEDLQAPDARPVAVFNAATTQTAKWVGVCFVGAYDPIQQEVGLGTPQPIPDSEDELTNGTIAMGILAAVKYMLPEGEVLVTTAKPTLATLKYEIILGEYPITLANGAPAWTAIYEALPYLNNQVIWIQGDVIITVASADLPLERLQELAVAVAMK